MWFPAAAVSPYITWEGIDAHSVEATMTYKGISASAIFHMNERGEITDVVAERYRGIGGGLALTTWVPRTLAYGEINEVRIPVESELAPCDCDLAAVYSSRRGLNPGRRQRYGYGLTCKQHRFTTPIARCDVATFAFC